MDFKADLLTRDDEGGCRGHGKWGAVTIYLELRSESGGAGEDVGFI